MATTRFKDEWLAAPGSKLPGVDASAVERSRGRLEFAADALIEAGAASAAVAALAAESAHTAVAADLAPEKLAVALVPERVCRRWRLLPLRLDGDVIEVAMADPRDADAVSDVQAVSGRPVRTLYALPSLIERAITETHDPDVVVFDLLRKVDGGEAMVEVEAVGVTDPADGGDAVRAPVVRLAGAIIAKAVKIGASDIHIEHEERQSVVRYRVDGALRTVMTVPRSIGSGPLVSRIKIMAVLDIADRMRPQDGRAKVIVGGVEMGLRVSTLPSQYGETTVIRILDPRSAKVPFASLGFHPDTAARLEKLMQAAQGMILVTGPTGSGKTTTLYSVLNKLMTGDTKIITAEDPIEYRLPGVNQVQVREKQGLGFAAVLRSCLRQDPDVLMVGEIRDKETAEVAFQAALTGHLVLSTVHANDAVSTVTRLVDMGVESFKMGPALLAVTAQRLVRRLCPDCRKKTERAWEPVGCAACSGTGWRGRCMLVELLEFNQEMRDALSAGGDEETLRRAARAAGAYRTLADEARWHVEEGHTTAEEVAAYMEAPGRPAPSDAAPAAASPAPASAPRRAKPRVLVCDDDAMARTILRKTLENDGYEVIEAADGAQGLAKAVAETPDLAVIDLHMPVLDGSQLLSTLRAGATGTFPVIVLTADAADGTEEKLLNLGADDYVAKPIKPAVVSARVKALFRRRDA